MDRSNESPTDDLEIEDYEDEDESYVTYDIVSYPADLTLSVVNEMWTNKDLEIPDFQRNFVWSPKQASLLIESFLLGLPVPQVFFYVDENNKNQVIDGQQRIISIISYLGGFFGAENAQGKKQVFRLKGIDAKSPFANKSFDDLDETHQRRLKNAVLRAIYIRQVAPKHESTSIYHIFERLNTGGTPLKPQEIRNCVFRGDFVGRLRVLNENEHWRLILGKMTLDKHQKDVELLLRVFALTYYFEKYEKPMKEFLNQIMNLEKKGQSSSLKAFEADFPVMAKKIVEVLGERPFHLRGRLNSSALDTVFAVLLRAKVELTPDSLTKYKELEADEAFKDTTHVSTSDGAVIRRRFEIVHRIMLR